MTRRICLLAAAIGAATLMVSGADAKKKAGDLMFHSFKVNKVLFLGNSITKHGPSAKIGWSGNWGMAASAENKDYVHVILDAFREATGQESKAMIANVATFERKYDAYDLDAGLKGQFAFGADLVIVAIGENVPNLTTDEAKTAFAASVAKLLAKLKENGNPTIVVRGCFWASAAKDAILKQACADAGGIFVDAGPLGKDEQNYARSEREFEHKGVAAHPGDRGMKAIADAILAALAK